MVVRPASEVCYKYHIYIYILYIYNVHIIHKPGVSQVGAVVSLFFTGSTKQGEPPNIKHQLLSTTHGIALTAGS